MARTFRRRHAQHPISELNVTNLIDLGFTLLIIFMITTSAKQEQTIPVQLPAESKSPQEKPDKDLRFVAISIDAKGNYYLANAPISLRDLKMKLHGFAAEPKQPVIRIRGDAKLPYEKVIALMDELKRQNLTKITFDTQTSN